MLVQEFLKTRTLDGLKDLAINVIAHEELPLVILDYTDLSPRLDPVVRECRGLVLHADTFDVVARAFPRFYNWGEIPQEMDQFDFTNFSTQSKEDGSIVLFYHFQGKWRANTRGSFALHNMPNIAITWQDAICNTLCVKSLDDLSLDPNYTYVCEFCSPWNKVVRKYYPSIYLLSIFENERELSPAEIAAVAPPVFSKPTQFNFKSIHEIQQFIQRQATEDETFEGVIIRDANNNRWKIKNPRYIELHYLRGNNNFHPRYLFEFVLNREEDELLVYFPEVSNDFYKLKSRFYEAYSQAVAKWSIYKEIPSKKLFAEQVEKDRHFNFLFKCYDKKPNTPQELWDIWAAEKHYEFKKLAKD